MLESLNLLNVGQIRDFVPAVFKKFYCLNSQVHDYKTRNSDDIAIESTGTVRSAFTVRYMGPLIWNKLPMSTRMAEHLVSFKKKLKDDLLESNYFF